LEQTYIIFLAKLRKPHFSPGPESLECQLFSLDDIPFDSLAFSSMAVTLKLVRACFSDIQFLNLLAFVTHIYNLLLLQYIEDVKAGSRKFHYGTINKRYFTMHFLY